MSKKVSKATEQANAQRAAERAAAIRREHEQKERRRRTIAVSVVVVGVLAVIAVIAVAVQSSRDTAGTGAGQVTSAPRNLVNDHQLPRGDESAPVTVTVYEDFMCPACGSFEASSSKTLTEYVDSGDVKVNYHVVSFLDDQSSNVYSTRAASALGVVADEAGAEAAVKFHGLLFEQQPQEGSAGLTDAQLVDLAVQAGADKAAVSGPIESTKFEPWVVDSTDQWSKDGFTSTPTVLVNGERLESNSVEELTTKIDAALKG